MSRFIAVIHGWHVYSNGFTIHELKARDAHGAECEGAMLCQRREKPFDACDYTVLEIDDREHLPRRLTWRERLTGRIDQ